MAEEKREDATLEQIVDHANSMSKADWVKKVDEWCLGFWNSTIDCTEAKSHDKFGKIYSALKVKVTA